MSIVYLDGDYIPLSRAKVSVLDRGFLFADGVYEVIPVYNGRIFRLYEHLLRLENSLCGIVMKNPLSMDEWATLLGVLIENNDGRHQSLYVQVTRGVSERDHLFPEQIIPTVFAMSKPLKKKSSSLGIAAVTLEDIRWKLCDLKTLALLPNVLLRNEARLKGATEAILHLGNEITEGVASNVFVCKGETITTPAKDNHILPGVTRDLVIELLLKNGFACREKSVFLSQLESADEIWITSSTREIVPVIKLNDKVVGSGEPGPLYTKANIIYQNFKENFYK